MPSQPSPPGHRPHRSPGRALLGTVLLALVATALPLAAGAAPAGAADRTGAEEPEAAPLEWVGSSTFRKVYDTAAEDPPRYINDHSVIKGPDDTWHLFGITGEMAPPGSPPDSSQEDTFAHATAPSLDGPWTTREPVLTVDPDYGEDHLWAPHVIEHQGTYYMFYSGGGGERDAAINLATSTDLYHWTRHPAGPLFRDGWVARDPMVVRDGDRWIMYYTATATPDGGNHVVAYRTSEDLVHWSERAIAFTDPTTKEDAPPVTESPFVVRRGGWWYLFTGPRGDGYFGTDVFRSKDPTHFALDDYAGHLPAHAPEIVRDGGKWWATHSGWYQGGLHLGELHWRSTPPPWHGPHNPAVARNEDGRLEVFALAADGSGLLRRAQTAPNGEWGAWQPFGANVGTLPSVAEHADGTLELFAPDAGGTRLLHRRQTSPGGEWGAWEDFGTTAGAAPSVVRAPDGRLELFAVAPGGSALRHRAQREPGGDWGDWEEFGGRAGGPPVAAVNDDGRLEVFVTAPGNDAVLHRFQRTPGGAWSPWERFGGPASDQITVVSHADGRLEVLVLNPYGDSVFNRTQTTPGGDWGAWKKFGTHAAATPTAVRDAEGRLTVFALGPGNDYVSYRRQTAPDGEWGDWQVLGGPAQCTPSPMLEADGRVTVLAVEPEGTGVARRTQTAPGGDWDEWHRFSGPVRGGVCGAAS